MKNKIFIALLIVFSIYFINVGKVYAENKLYFECDENKLKVGDTTVCRVVIECDEPIMGIVANVEHTSSLEISDAKNLTDFFGDALIYYFGTKDLTLDAGTHQIASFKIKARREDNAAMIYFVEHPNDGIIFGTPDKRKLKPNTEAIILTVTSDSPDPGREKSSDSSLKNLSTPVGELKPAFNPTITSYDIENVDFTKIHRIDFTAIENDEHATKSGTTCLLPNSSDVIETTCYIFVTAEDGSYTDYKIKVHNSAYNPVDPDEPTEDKIIAKNITTDAGILTPAFNKDIFEYSLSLNFANFKEVKFYLDVEDGIEIENDTCKIPNNDYGSFVCSLSIINRKTNKKTEYPITIINTNRPGEKCDLNIKSNVYTIDQAKKLIRLNGEHDLETIKSNLYSDCGAITVFEDKAVLTSPDGIVEYTIEKLVMPQTGNNKLKYPLAFFAVLLLILAAVCAKVKFGKKEN